MKHGHAGITIVMLLAVGLAGCTQSGQQARGWTLEVLEVPANVQMNESFTIRWKISGPETTTDHTAVHFGLTSTSDKAMEDVAIPDYDALTEVRTGDVPGEYEATMRLDFPGTIHFRAHTIVDGVNWWSPEQTIQVDGTPMEVTDFPQTTPAGTDATVQWRVHHLRSTQIPHTAVHFGPDSQDVALRQGNPFAYPKLVPDPAHQGQIPATFDAKIPTPEPGPVYFRAHAVIDGTNWLSAEHRLYAVNPPTPNAVILDAPAAVNTSETFNVTFQANVPQNNTALQDAGAVHDSVSRDRNRTAYGNETTVVPPERPATAPTRIQVPVTAPDEPGALFVRGFFQTLANDTDILTDERRIPVRAATGVSVVSAPDCVELDGDEASVNVTMRVSGPDQRSGHIGVHWDDEANHTGDEESAGDYAHAGPHGGGEVPATFQRHFNVTETGTYYFRAHATLDDGPHVSAEHSVDVESGLYACP